MSQHHPLFDQSNNCRWRKGLTMETEVWSSLFLNDSTDAVLLNNEG
jgi:hypothetical protein